MLKTIVTFALLIFVATSAQALPGNQWQTIINRLEATGVRGTHHALRMYLERKKKTSPGFSMRSLARRMDVSPSFLSRALNGKKSMPAELQTKLALALDVEPELLNTPKQNHVAPAVEDWVLTEKDAIKILRNWYYLPLLELTTLENFDGSTSEIARRLGLSNEVAEIALRELTSLGLIKWEDGKPKKADTKIRFTSSKTVQAFRKFHDDMLEKAQQELRSATTEEEFHQRLITGITLTGSEEAVQAAKRKLASCLHEIANDLVSTPGTEVFQLSAQLFRLSRR